MTTEQKKEWLENAESEMLIEQMRWAIAGIESDSIKLQIRGKEEFELIAAEMLKRMKKEA